MQLIAYGLSLLQEHITLFHNLVACANSTLDGNNVMADNESLYR